MQKAPYSTNANNQVSAGVSGTISLRLTNITQFSERSGINTRQTSAIRRPPQSQQLAAAVRGRNHLAVSLSLSLHIPHFYHIVVVSVSSASVSFYVLSFRSTSLTS
ncbi:hypothetical protein ASPSYDRAFT_454160 [Aspergillus sydowii CBS 593.65]|uniref:Uncharacterized protein n=1 Tax=Aspergillus sydowii CBS 593.65 TaxID=1036612 RepID=A0A1L9T7A5_9EURO|nr:uncharacterized protein ASPSYDRAFT_454160 [Aspergillus sydowii CBS 593.65]OJJ55251.1 hypothetical protein ASPSYDRAFT_454160 [Aspergillus sydowii CBS 593.65]